MKKIFIVFIISVIVATLLIIPCAASMTNSFGSYTNLFDPSDVVQARFYTSISDYQDNNFYSVDLQSDQTYTFISTKGSRSFYSGYGVVYDNYNSVFAFNSFNYYKSTPIVNESQYAYREFYNSNMTPGSYVLSFEYSSSFSFDVLFQIGTTTSNRRNLVNVTIPAGSGTYSVEFTVPQDMYDTYGGSYLLLIRALNGPVSLNSIITKDPNQPGYVPYYVDPVFNDELTYVYTFTSPRSGSFLIGINDVLAGSSTNQFSYNQSSENEFYLVKGSLTPDQIADVLQQDRYNQGFTEGYKEGEFDGLNSTKFMNSTLLTAISAPFVIVSSALNFEIFGINFYHILQVLFTLLLVAFVVTKLKGRE